MKPKKVKARKEHICDQCKLEIFSGDKYMLYEWRTPKYAPIAEMNESVLPWGDDVENQIGINYNRHRICMKCEEYNNKSEAEIEALMQTDEYKYWASMQEHVYP